MFAFDITKPLTRIDHLSLNYLLQAFHLASVRATVITTKEQANLVSRIFNKFDRTRKKYVQMQALVLCHFGKLFVCFKVSLNLNIFEHRTNNMAIIILHGKDSYFGCKYIIPFCKKKHHADR